MNKKPKELLKTFGLLIGLGIGLCLVCAVIAMIICYFTGEPFNQMFFAVAVIFVLGFFAIASAS